MPACHPSPAAQLALREATALFPNRRRTSDGTCASATHHQQNPGSDHEPNIRVGDKWYESAFDLSHDPTSGCDAHKFAELLRTIRDPRIKYVISNSRMYSSYSGHDAKTGKLFRPWEWRPYYGSNHHTTHMHVSILPDYIFDTKPWWTPLLQTEDGMMAWTDKDSANLESIKQSLLSINHEIAGAATQNSRLGIITKAVTAIRDKILQP